MKSSSFVSICRRDEVCSSSASVGRFEIEVSRIHGTPRQTEREGLWLA